MGFTGQPPWVPGATPPTVGSWNPGAQMTRVPDSQVEHGPLSTSQLFPRLCLHPARLPHRLASLGLFFSRRRKWAEPWSSPPPWKAPPTQQQSEVRGGMAILAHK